MPEGIITKAISGFYYVRDGEAVRQCRARGIFKKNGITPLVGDHVIYEPIGSAEGVVDQILPRQNTLVRPPVANLDQVVLTFSAREPDLNLKLLDRMLVHVEEAGLEAVIFLTKVDLLEDISTLERQMKPYRDMGYQTVFLSAREKTGVEEAATLLRGKLSGLAGNSGVGKSTFLNALLPELNLSVGEISQKLGRGKHTTRHSEIFYVEEDTYVIDTPGFSTLDFKEMEPADLDQYFRDVWQASQNCKYRGCLHESEDGCAVRAAAQTNGISEVRYANYLEFLREVKEAKEWRY